MTIPKYLTAVTPPQWFDSQRSRQDYLANSALAYAAAWGEPYNHVTLDHNDGLDAEYNFHADGDGRILFKVSFNAASDFLFSPEGNVFGQWRILTPHADEPCTWNIAKRTMVK